MALQKDTEYKGITCNYWKILTVRANCGRETTDVTLGLFYDKAARDADINNILKELTYTYEELDLTRAVIYGYIKASVMTTKEVAPAIYDEYGVLIQEGTSELVETNPFADAVDVLE